MSLSHHFYISFSVALLCFFKISLCKLGQVTVLGFCKAASHVPWPYPHLHSRVQRTAGCPGLSEANVPDHENCSLPSLLLALPSKAAEAWGQAGGFIGHALFAGCYGPALQTWRSQV